ncbi:MAG: hypothetical protein PHH86_06890 [Sphaerochaetaceae bacterium]|nr:hypothetical protein [Sphaerochaetaceae bacterium]
MAKTFMQKLFGTKQEKDLRRLQPLVQLVNEQESWAQNLNDDQIRNQTKVFRDQLLQVLLLPS